MKIPELGKPLEKEHLEFLTAFAKSCRKAILEMTTNAQSGHPGGSLSSIDYLAVLYTFIISQTGEPVIISNGHISPGVYSVLAELGYIPKDDVVQNFRKVGHVYEGHVTRHVKGVWYGTGPLGIGTSVASAFALAEKLKKSDKHVYGLMGDGESQEGQVHEMMHFVTYHKLTKLTFFMDYNKVQLSDSLANTMEYDIKASFEAGGWHVIEIDAHDYQQIWSTLAEAQKITDKATLILGNSIMGKGVDFMESEGLAHRATWHGKGAKPEEIAPVLPQLTPTGEEQNRIDDFKKLIKWQPPKPQFPPLLSQIACDTGKHTNYPADQPVDCRTAYGKALLDLAKRNKNVLALTADLRGSVMTSFVAEELPTQHIECGIAEQQMVSCSGGLSLAGFIPFCSTFGAFMTSRAKDQARVNDVNHTNVKMVATHCGLSVGEDGPTHQAIDDMGSFLGFFDTMIIEPADANQCDHIIRYVASHYGNFYVRMGRHKFNPITREDGSLFYDDTYEYEYGKCDVIREGDKITVAATGAMVGIAMEAREKLENPNDVEIVAVSSIKRFDDAILASISKTKKLVTVEDHNTFNGLGSQLVRHCTLAGIIPDNVRMIGPESYQLSGTWKDLYEAARITAPYIADACKRML